MGFGPAANQASEIAPGDVLLFLNPDTRAEGNPFSGIARAFEANPRVVAVAPRLIEFDTSSGDGQSATWVRSGMTEGGGTRGAEGTSAGATRAGRRLAPPGREDQFTFQLRRLPTLASDARELLLIDHLFPDSPARRLMRYADRNREAPFEVEQAAAAALAVRKSAFRRIGGFDERYVPAWFEDVDLCARLLSEGKILYSPEACFRHRGGLSSRRLTYERFLAIYYRNALLYRRKHYRRSARIAYRPLLFAGMLLRLAALPFRRAMPRSRSEAARGYLRVLRLVFDFPPPAAFRRTTPGGPPLPVGEGRGEGKA